ncbi:MAG: hypothetical protein MZU91_07160 [Desulfosudis oleivorans]|nr:hypothetical protein [Desulfosudis oleivorans]
MLKTEALDLFGLKLPRFSATSAMELGGELQRLPAGGRPRTSWSPSASSRGAARRWFRPRASPARRGFISRKPKGAVEPD